MTAPGFDGLFDELCARRGIGCALADPDGVVLAIGGAGRIWGDLRPGGALLDVMPELFGADDAIEQAVAAGEQYVLPWINRDRLDGRAGFYELSVHGHPDDPRIRVYWLADVTAAGRLKSELNQERNELSLTRDALDLRNRDLQLFLRAAGHDLKSPLRTLVGFLDLIAAEHDSPLVDASRSLATELAELVEALLAYARLGGAAVEQAPMPLGPAFTQALDRLALTVAERDARIELPGQWPMVIGDRTLVGQLFYNLVDNALKYCPAERTPHLRVEIEPIEARVRVAVEDNGAGIRPEARARVFEPLVRLNRSVAGHGFGLATVQRCAELMRGRVVAVQPRSLGGARFEVELPVP